MSGGKGGSQTTQVEIPQWLSNAAQANLAQGRDVSKIGYTPYYGPDVAAVTPTQQAARSNVDQFAKAFGMQGIQESALPQATNYAGGISGYSSGGLYDQAVQELAARRPGQYSKMQENFVDPYNGSAPNDRYGNYFAQTSTPSGDVAVDSENFANTLEGSQPQSQGSNILFNGIVYNLSDPAQVLAYQEAYAASVAVQQNQSDQKGQPGQQNQPEQQQTAEQAVAALRSAPDWKSLSGNQKIQRVVELANRTGLTAGDLAAFLPYEESVIEGYI